MTDSRCQMCGEPAIVIVTHIATGQEYILCWSHAVEEVPHMDAPDFEPAEAVPVHAREPFDV